MPPTKGLPYPARVRLLAERAEGRYRRRRAVVTWFTHWTRARWNDTPRLITKVHYGFVRDLRAFRTYRPRVTRYKRHDGTEVRLWGTHILYEDCLHLEHQALMLMDRLRST